MGVSSAKGFDDAQVESGRHSGMIPSGLRDGASIDAILKEGPVSTTWHGFQEPGKLEFEEFIDWILYSDGIEVQDFKIETSNQDGLYSSDHFPLIGEFSIE